MVLKVGTIELMKPSVLGRIDRLFTMLIPHRSGLVAFPHQAPYKTYCSH